MPSTPRVSCTVIAVTTDSGWQPMLANVRMSACRPAPPVGSDAANVSTIGGKSGSLSAGIAGAARESAAAARNADESAQARRRVPFGRLARIAGFYSNGSAYGFTMKKYMCLICGWIYDEALGAPDEGIAPGTKWEDVPPNWTCPECGARKEDFELAEF